MSFLTRIILRARTILLPTVYFKDHSNIKRPKRKFWLRGVFGVPISNVPYYGNHQSKGAFLLDLAEYQKV